METMIQLQPLSQMDFRWKNKQLGADPAVTIGKYGCLLTSMAVVANYYGCDETPASLNDHMLKVGGFQGALVIPALISGALPSVRFQKYVQCSSPPAPLADIDASLAARQPVIVKVDYSKAPGIQDHWVVLYAKQGNDYLIQDPWPNPPDVNPVTLAARFGFAGTADKIILAALWLSGTPGPQPIPPQPAPLPDSGFAVYAAADSLALRTSPQVADNNLIERVPVGAKFWSLEPQDAATQKIGQANQWLNVRNIQGEQGYVAAWLVSPLLQPAALGVSPTGSKPTAAPNPDDPLVVRAAEDGLALRSQPVISDLTLIKRLPISTELLVLEPAAAATAKLGVVNQWLNVRDIYGDAGYVAAWFVVKNPPPGIP